MAWQTLVAPNLRIEDGAGWCLRYARRVFGAPGGPRSAWHGWKQARYRHGPEEPIPGGVAVLLWFEHWGAYDDGLGPYDGLPVGAVGNWGHVAVHVSGDAIYTSPGSGYGFERWATIGQIEARFRSKYVGWSEDINGLRVAVKKTELQPQEEDMMLTFVASAPNGTWYVTDGLTKRPLAPGENQLLVDLGQARYPEKPGRVQIISAAQLARIPDQGSALPLDTAGLVAEVVEAIKATGVTVEVDYEKAADVLLDRAAERLRGATP